MKNEWSQGAQHAKWQMREKQQEKKSSLILKILWIIGFPLRIILFSLTWLIVAMVDQKDLPETKELFFKRQ